MIFRAPVFPFYFVILGIAAFSFSPGMVLWTGIAGALGWLGAFLHAAGGIDDSLNWRVDPATPDRGGSHGGRARTRTSAGSAAASRRRSCSWSSRS